MKVIVIGAGIIGLAASYELEKAGHEVLLIEDGPAQASAGENRIFRTFHEDPLLEEEAKRAAGLWRAWEEELEEELIRRTGLWLHGGWSTGAGYQEALGHYPLMKEEAIYALDSEGGLGKIEKTMGLLNHALLGKRIKERVTKVEKGRVFCQGGEILEADFVVVAAGHNTRSLLGRDEGKIFHHVRFLFPARRDEILEDLPVLIDKDLALYGLPEKGGFALGLVDDQELGFTNVKNHDQERRKMSFISSRRERLRQIVAAYFPGLVPEPGNYIYCLRDEKNSDGYELERGGGFLGITGNNLFKFAPLLGRLALEEAKRYEET